MHPGVLVPEVAREAFRDGELHLPGKLGVLPLLRPLDLVPQDGPVTAPCWRVCRSEDLGVDHLGLGKAEGDSATLIPEGTASTIGSGRNDGTTVRATLGSTPNDLDRKMKETGSEGHGRTLLGCRGWNP